MCHCGAASGEHFRLRPLSHFFLLVQGFRPATLTCEKENKGRVLVACLSLSCTHSVELHYVFLCQSLQIRNLDVICKRANTSVSIITFTLITRFALDYAAHFSPYITARCPRCTNTFRSCRPGSKINSRSRETHQNESRPVLAA